MYKKISAVLIDTSAYFSNQFDFIGINRSIIPMLSHLLEQNGIVLLSHPILENEIRKHIHNSELVKRDNELQQLMKRCNEQLKLIEISGESLANSIANFKIEAKLNVEFRKMYKHAVVLPYADPKVIFEDYFHANPPFRPSQKKSEFPDAFILGGLREYCNINKDTCVLAISDDIDWKKTIEQIDGACYVPSMEAAMGRLWNQIEDRTDLVKVLLSYVKDDLWKNIKDSANEEAYCINTIDTYEGIDVVGVSVTGIDDDVVPLDIKESSVLLQVNAHLAVDGVADYLDEGRSMWDREDNQYYYLAYTHIEFRNALAEVDCEVVVDFAQDNWPDSIRLTSVKLVNRFDVPLNIDEAEVTATDITGNFRDDYNAERDDAFEEYNKH